MEIENFFGTTNIEEIKKLESYIGIELPKDYRQFLVQYNGGVPTPSSFFVNQQGDNTIDLFYGIINNEEYDIYNLKDVLRSMKSEIPGNLIPIGHDPGGNKIILSVSGIDSGRVYFWDHEMEAPDNLYLIATNFTEFLEKLH